MKNFPLNFFEDVSLSVVVPIFNEGPQIKVNLSLLLTELRKYFKNFNVIAISDGSNEETNQALRSIQDNNIEVIFNDRNEGKGAVLKKGFSKTNNDFVIFIDGGMEIHPKEIRIFLGLMFLYNADIVIGSKRHPQSKVFYPWYRKILSFIFQKIVHLMFKIDVTDTQVGLKMFRGNLIQKIYPLMKSNSYGVDLEILGLAKKFGYEQILEAPVRLDYFLKNKRSFVKEFLHTFRVGILLVVDSFKIWLSLRNHK